MPILKASDPTPERPVIILIYGDPGNGKTTLFNTAKKPLLIDFDRGRDRALLRKDTLTLNTWNDVLVEEKAGTFKEYSTIGIDTAKAALDDFLMSYVVANNYKLRTNKLQAYGAIGDEFKVFVNNRRNEQADLVIIAHSKEVEDGDLKKKSPDVTGGSLSLLLRIADQVGYLSIKNGKRTLQFEPTDTSIGKNVAKIGLIEIPGENDPALENFLAGIIEQVRNSISKMSEAQAEAIEKVEKLQRQINTCKEVDTLNQLVTAVQGLPKPQRAGLLALIGNQAKAKGWEWKKEEKVFVVAAPAPTAPPAPVQETPATEPAPATEPVEEEEEVNF